MDYTHFISGLIALILTLAFVAWTRNLSIRHEFMFDWPHEHKIHRKPVPCIGGIGMAGAFGFAVISELLLFNRPSPLSPIFGILVAGGLGLLLGTYDDLCGMKAWQKFTGQLMIATVLMLFGLRVERMEFPVLGQVSFSGVAILGCTFFWVAATMNAVNLIDGLDGLAAGVSLTSALGMLLLASLMGNTSATLVAVGVVGVCLGFLYYNFYPATVFMGDCGSMFLGATFAGLGLLITQNGTTPGSLWIPITILTIPFLDTTLAIIRRLARRQPTFLADTMHLHHQLLDFGLSQPQTVSILCGLGLLMAVFAIACFRWSDAAMVNVIAGIGLILLTGGLVMTSLHRKVLTASRVSKKEESGE